MIGNALYTVRSLFFVSKNIKSKEGVSKLIHPLFYSPSAYLPHNLLFTAAMLLISYKMICWTLNSLYKPV